MRSVTQAEAVARATTVQSHQIDLDRTGRGDHFDSLTRIDVRLRRRGDLERVLAAREKWR